MLTYTVVIPVYNAEKYLESCIDSVLSQNTASGFEIILVDDGSADRSGQICDRYAERLDCVKVIHQNNQGVSAARNAGIAAAGGAYILLLDGDDCWKPNLLQTLDLFAKQQKDVIEFGYERFCGGDIREVVIPAVQVADKTGMEYFEAHAEKDCMPIGSSCAAAFRRQLLLEHDLRYPLGVSYGEDFIFHMNCLKHAQSVVSIQEPLYRYRINEQSATHTLTAEKIRDMLSACAQVYRQFPYVILADHYCMRILRIAELSRKEAAQLCDFLRENSDILHCVSGKKARIARVLYKVLGWYDAARLVQRLLQMRHG